MALIRSYHSKPRLAKVLLRYEEDSHSDPSTAMLLQGESVRFIADDLTFALDERSAHECALFNHGDIVAIDATGVLQRVFDTQEGGATVYITGKCNSNCIMCPSSERSRRSDEGPSDEWLQKYIGLLPADTPHVVVTGGEPTLRTSTFFMAMKRISAQLPRTEVLLLTNGRSFASKAMVKRLIANCPQFLTAGIPLHGSTDELHDAITQAEGSFDQTCKGIRNLIAEGVSIELRVVVSRMNHHDLLAIAEFICDNLPIVASVKIMGLETLGNCAKNFNEVYVSPQDSWQHIDAAILRLADQGIPVQLYNYPLCAVPKNYWHLCKRSITPSKVRYAPQCDQCDARSICSGFFFSTLSMAKPSVQPIRLN